MKRRSFLTTSAGTALTAGITGCGGNSDDKNMSEAEDTTIAGMTLEQLRDRYKADLFEKLLPFMDRHVIDHDHGGFMCNTRPDGTTLKTTKRAGYEGRGIWVYSYLYNNIAREQKYLDIAEKSVHLLMKNKPEPPALWPSSFTKEGEPASAPSKSVNSDMYIADGLQEYAKATGDSSWLDFSRDVLMKCLWVYDREGYGAGAGRGYVGKEAPALPGVRIMDDWMLFLWVATQMLKQKSDMDILMLVTQCLDTIMNKFYNPETGLIGEILNPNYTRPKHGYDQIVNIGNDIQAIWNVMAAANRIDNRDQFKTASELLKRHIEVGWDDVYGGMFSTLANVDKNIWRLSKSHYLQAEPLVALLMVIEKTGAEWAKDWFGRIYAYEQETFHLDRHGYPFWMNGTDRKGSFVLENCTRVGNFHQPRHLMMNLVRLEKMIGA